MKGQVRGFGFDGPPSDAAGRCRWSSCTASPLLTAKAAVALRGAGVVQVKPTGRGADGGFLMATDIDGFAILIKGVKDAFARGIYP